MFMPVNMVMHFVYFLCSMFVLVIYIYCKILINEGGKCVKDTCQYWHGKLYIFQFLIYHDHYVHDIVLHAASAARIWLTLYNPM